MAKKDLKKGIFITLEGPEGCGKSTHAKLLYSHLRKHSYDCMLTREPGGTKVGEYIRKILLHSKDLAMSDFTELFLFEANRAEIVREVIRPALDDKKIVICELNMGQFANYLRIKHQEFNYEQINKVQGLPFTVNDIKEKCIKMLEDK